MTEPADQQSESAWCLTEETRDGVGYICTRETHDNGRHKMIRRADMPDALRNALAAQDLISLDDTTPEVIPDTPPSAAMQTMASLSRLVGLAELDRRIDFLSYEVKTGIAIAEDLAECKERWAADLLADLESLERIKKRVDALLTQKGLYEDGGS